MVSTPYTRWHGDSVHGHRPVLTPVWVRLEAVCVRAPDAPHRVIPDGLDMTGEVPGLLSGWFRSVHGDWLGIVNYSINYADARQHQVTLADQLVPGYAIRKRDKQPTEHPDSPKPGSTGPTPDSRLFRQPNPKEREQP